MDPETRSQMRTDQNKAALRSLFELAGEHGYSERITRAGLPTAITFAGRSLTTTAPAPTTVFSPMLTPGQTITPPPSQTLSPPLIPLARLRSAPPGWVGVKNCTLGPTWTSSPILMAATSSRTHPKLMKHLAPTW